MSSPVSDLVEAMPGLISAKRALPALLDPKSGIQFVILYGAPATGQDELARFLCQGWLCVGPEPRPCGACAPCRALVNNRAVDCIVVEPYGAGRTHKLGCLAKRDDEAEPYKGIYVREFIRTRPLMSSAKVVWFVEADRMERRVSNALLKTLEESSGYLRFIFTTDQLHKIPTTVRSRAVLVPCEAPAMDEWPNQWGQDDLICRFARTPGDAAKVNLKRKTFERLDTLLTLSMKAHARESLKLAEEMGEIMDDYCDGAKSEKRNGQQEVLEFASTWILGVQPEKSPWIRAIAAAHRAINGYAQIKIVLQALFLTGTLDTTN